MDLTTRCPNCGTVFQASLSDLQLRKGYIRCVQCAHIFDGYAEVVRDAAQPAGSAASAADYLGPGADAEPATSSLPGAAPVAPPEPWEDVPPQVIRAGHPPAFRSVPPRESAFRVGVAPWPDDGRGAGRSWNEPHVGRATEDASAMSEEAESARESFSPRSGAIVVEAHPSYRGAGGSAAPLLQDGDASRPWTALTRFLGGSALVVLGLLFFAQLVYVYRAQIAQTVPTTRPWLEQLCVPLHCRVAYARDISEISITGSALKVADSSPSQPATGSSSSHATQSQDEQHFVLRFTLRNELGQPQQWPTLVLDLKDGAGTPVVRRNLSPAEYLGPTMTGVPFAAHSDVLVQLPLTLSGVRINGYQLDLFFP